MGKHANDHIVTFTDFRSSETSCTLSAQTGQKFTDVAFNDAGDLLFAWAYGQKDSLYIWRCQDGVMSENLEFGAGYKTVSLCHQPGRLLAPDNIIVQNSQAVSNQSDPI